MVREGQTDVEPCFGRATQRQPLPIAETALLRVESASRDLSLTCLCCAISELLTATTSALFGTLSRSRVMSQRTENATRTTIHSLNPLAMEEIWSTRSNVIDWTAV
jgi:hypothetical protein